MQNGASKYKGKGRNGGGWRRPEERIEPSMAAGRVPPHDLDAEAAVLAAIMLDAMALDSVLEILKPEYFYSDANGKIFGAAVALAADHKPVDIVTVAGVLRDSNSLAQIGGAVYLAQIADATPAVAHVAAHAKVVVEKWRLRQLIARCQKIAAEGYGEVESVQEFIDQAEQAIYELAQMSRTKAGVAHVGTVLRTVFANMHAAATAGKRITGTPTGYAKFDEKTSGQHEGDLTVIAARPGVGKTSAVLNMAVNVASPRELEVEGVKHTEQGDGVMVFSLEMPREQLASRMVCSEARVDLGRMRNATLLPDDWRRLTEAASYLSALPLWIDDTSSITLLELRAKVRRQQAEYNREAKPATGTTPATPARKVGLVVVDYLQLMKGTGDEGSREQEISGLSRGLKALAKELRVPVIALSQLSRAVETRGKDKRPQLSDLRECMVGETMIADAVTGDLVRLDASPRSAIGLGSDLHAKPTTVIHSWSTGQKPVLLVTTASGRTLRCTGNHPLRTLDGWLPVDDIKIGTRIAVPRIVPEPTAPTNPYTADELRLLGYLISDGHYGKHRSVGYVKADPVLVDDVVQIARRRFGIEAHDHPCPGIAKQVELTVPHGGPGGNPLLNWLRTIGIHGQIGAAKRVPADLWRCDNQHLAIFLGALWAGDGTIVPRPKGGWSVKFSSTSMGLLDDVQWALTRLGIIYSRGPAGRNSKSSMDIATIVVNDADQIMRFAEVVPLPGIKGERLRQAAVECATMGRNARLDRLPIEITARVEMLKKAKGLSWSQLGYRCQGKEMCREDLARVAVVLGDYDLATLATSDVLWDEVVSVQPDGVSEVYDLRAPSTANVVANGIFAHNSGAIEQDADMIVFLFRPAYYDPKNKPGLAELIIAKQRNGPTGTVYVKYTDTYTRFEDFPYGEEPPADDDA